MGVPAGQPHVPAAGFRVVLHPELEVHRHVEQLHRRRSRRGSLRGAVRDLREVVVRHHQRVVAGRLDLHEHDVVVAGRTRVVGPGEIERGPARVVRRGLAQHARHVGVGIQRQFHARDRGARLVRVAHGCTSDERLHRDPEREVDLRAAAGLDVHD